MIDAEILKDAALDVEAGYINRPDRTTLAYWIKIARRYEYLSSRAFALGRSDSPDDAEEQRDFDLASSGESGSPREEAK